MKTEAIDAWQKRFDDVITRSPRSAFNPNHVAEHRKDIRGSTIDDIDVERT
jgi:hypothetical protein